MFAFFGVFLDPRVWLVAALAWLVGVGCGYLERATHSVSIDKYTAAMGKIAAIDAIAKAQEVEYAKRVAGLNSVIANGELRAQVEANQRAAEKATFTAQLAAAHDQLRAIALPGVVRDAYDSATGQSSAQVSAGASGPSGSQGKSATVNLFDYSTVCTNNAAAQNQQAADYDELLAITKGLYALTGAAK